MLLSNLSAYKLSGTIDLQNGRLKVFLYNSVFRSKLAWLWAEYPYDTFKTTNDNFVHRGIAVIHIAYADRIVVKLLTCTNICGPPLLKLEYRHTSFKSIIFY